MLSWTTNRQKSRMHWWARSMRKRRLPISSWATRHPCPRTISMKPCFSWSHQQLGPFFLCEIEPRVSLTSVQWVSGTYHSHFYLVLNTEVSAMRTRSQCKRPTEQPKHLPVLYLETTTCCMGSKDDPVASPSTCNTSGRAPERINCLRGVSWKKILSTLGSLVRTSRIYLKVWPQPPALVTARAGRGPLGVSLLSQTDTFLCFRSVGRTHYAS